MVLFPGTDVLLTAALSIFLFLALCAALVLIVIALRRPTTYPLMVAGILVVVALLVVAISPVNTPALMGLILTMLGVAVAVLGGNPISRRVLDVAAGSRVRETEDGGIIVAARDEEAATGEPRTLMRGGRVIGYLERLAAVVAIVVGYPEAIAVVVAVKGIGRFSELSEPESRERFIVGTLASLLWACVLGARCAWRSGDLWRPGESGRSRR
ncbi:hypothetical protein [Microbacterium elymi]|uniref:Uncharacterized protein n=1 Tax=Microbacterium elymi TaxID=2909587 RepID=A0ABY5NIW5_9MICO|nr:hypothetical protein [Microbacterium elymi]UUT35119.1 hypothetical protein L2X98_33200 [Microbacterium elymi]